MLQKNYFKNLSKAQRYMSKLNKLYIRIITVVYFQYKKWNIKVTEFVSLMEKLHYKETLKEEHIDTKLNTTYFLDTALEIMDFMRSIPPYYTKKDFIIFTLTLELTCWLNRSVSYLEDWKLTLSNDFKEFSKKLPTMFNKLGEFLLPNVWVEPELEKRDTLFENNPRRYIFFFCTFSVTWIWIFLHMCYVVCVFIWIMLVLCFWFMRYIPSAYASSCIFLGFDKHIIVLKILLILVSVVILITIPIVCFNYFGVIFFI